ncbi:MAG: DUF4258 domain-containing protein [Anaerolineae bacterium]|nr:DUF4258 domain-containing protein [Anaerolineae bacterium]
MLEPRIIYTYHARRRMTQRTVTEEQVEETLSEPDIPYLSGAEGEEEIAVRQYGSREIRVIFEEQKSGIIVVLTVIAKPLKHADSREEVDDP